VEAIHSEEAADYLFFAKVRAIQDSIIIGNIRDTAFSQKKGRGARLWT